MHRAGWDEFGPLLRRCQRLGYADMTHRINVACLYVQSLHRFPEKARQAFAMLADAERALGRIRKSHYLRKEGMQGITHARAVAASARHYTAEVARAGLEVAPMSGKVDWDPIRELAQRVLEKGEPLELTIPAQDAVNALRRPRTAIALLRKIRRRIREGSWRLTVAGNRVSAWKMWG